MEGEQRMHMVEEVQGQPYTVAMRFRKPNITFSDESSLADQSHYNLYWWQQHYFSCMTDHMQSKIV